MGGLIESGFVIEHSEAFGGSLCLMLHWGGVHGEGSVDMVSVDLVRTSCSTDGALHGLESIVSS